MHKVEFRGKRLNGDMWVFGFYHTEYSIESPSSNRKIIRHHIYTQNYDLFVEENSVGQFTGITDINNKKIYELDVVQDRCGGFYLVKYSPQKMSFVLVQGNIEWTLSGFEELEGIQTQTFEVIGNIVDNPELINLCEQGCI